MKKCLYILFALQILLLIVGFFTLLGQSVFLAIMYVAVDMLMVVLTYVVINNMNNIEELWAENSRLRFEVRKIKDLIKDESTDEKLPPAIEYKESARGNWKCVKCDTVNKAGSSYCSNCRAEYSAFLNPTEDPYKKKRFSRWIK